MPRHTGAQSLDLSGTPVQPRRSSRATKAPDRLINHTDEPRSTRATPSNQKSKDQNPRYAILIQRLAKTLKDNPQAIGEDEEESTPSGVLVKWGISVGKVLDAMSQHAISYGGTWSVSPKDTRYVPDKKMVSLSANFLPNSLLKLRQTCGSVPIATR
jgi:hypothetical protein